MRQKLKVLDASHLEELNKEKKCCLIINDLVYDVTTFLEHPGGFEVLLEQNGKDATQVFNDIGHTDEAKKLMKQYLIGIQKGSKKHDTYKNTVVKENNYEYVEISEEEYEESEEVKEIPFSKQESEEAKNNYFLFALIILLFSCVYYILFIRN